MQDWRRTLEILLTLWIALIQLVRACERERRYEDFVQALAKARESGGTTASLSFLGLALAASGRRQEAHRVLEELQALSKKTNVPPCNLSFVHAALGDVENAIAFLERAHQEKDVRLVFLGVEPAWDPLRNARFIALLKRMKL